MTKEGTGAIPTYSTVSVTTEEYKKFEALASKIVKVPKDEIAKREKKAAAAKRR